MVTPFSHHEIAHPGLGIWTFGEAHNVGAAPRHDGVIVAAGPYRG